MDYASDDRADQEVWRDLGLEVRERCRGNQCFHGQGQQQRRAWGPCSPKSSTDITEGIQRNEVGIRQHTWTFFRGQFVMMLTSKAMVRMGHPSVSMVQLVLMQEKYGFGLNMSCQGKNY